MFSSWNLSLTEGVRCGANRSRTRRLRSLKAARGRVFQTHAVFKSTSKSIPAGIVSFSIVFRLKIIISFSLVLSAICASTNLKFDFSWPVVLIQTIFLPFAFTVVEPTICHAAGRFIHVPDVRERKRLCLSFVEDVSLKTKHFNL